jgi:hypothetical protein
MVVSGASSAVEDDFWTTAPTFNDRYNYPEFKGAGVHHTGYTYTSVSTDIDVGGYKAGANLILHQDAENKIIVSDGAISGTVSEQRFRFDMHLDRQLRVREILDLVCSHCRATWWEDGGLLKIHIEDSGDTSGGDIDPEDMVESSFQHWEEATENIPDAIIGWYWPPAKGWTKASVTMGAIRDGGITDEREYPGCAGGGQVIRLLNYAWKIAQVDRRCSFSTPLDTIALEPGDIRTIYHPLGGTAYGYDTSSKDAPTKNAGSGLDMIVMSINDDAQANIRTYTCREFSAAALADDPGVALPEDPRDTRGLRPPIPVTNLTATFLGDTTDDGIWNPQVGASWGQTREGLIAYWLVYQALEGEEFSSGQLNSDLEGNSAWGLEWELVAQVETTRFQWFVTGFTGTMYVTVIPVGVTGMSGSFDDAPITSVAVVSDTTAPDWPSSGANIVVSFTDRLVFSWDPPTVDATDFSHYLTSIDNWVTSTRVNTNSAEIVNPSSRSFTFRVKPVDHTGNEGFPDSLAVTLTAPAAPDISYLQLAAEWNTIELSVSSTLETDSGAGLAPGHRGFLYQYSWTGVGSWVDINPIPDETATTVLTWADIFPSADPSSVDVYIRYAEADIFTVILDDANWSTTTSVNLVRPVRGEHIDTGNFGEGELTGADSLRLTAGGDITLVGSSTDPGVIEFEGTSKDSIIGVTVAGTKLILRPSLDGAVDLNLGTDEEWDGTSGDHKFNDIELFADSHVNLFIGGTNYTRAEFNSTTTPSVQLTVSGTTRTVQFIFSEGKIDSTVHKLIDLGDATSAFNNCYAFAYPTVLDFYDMGHRKNEKGDIVTFSDVKVISGIKGKSNPEYSDVTGFELIDDNTLPEWIYHREGGEVARDPDGKPYADLKTLISLLMGAVRELAERLEALEKKP